MAEYQGIVVNAKGDPKKKLRVQVRIPGLMDGVPDDKLPWAEYRMPVGAGAGRGDFTPAQKGDTVWMDFPYQTHGKEDTRKPRIVGSVHNAPSGVLNTPDESYGKEFPHDRSGEGVSIESVGGYHGSKVITFHDSTVEFVPDGTLRFFSRKSSSNVEILPDGRILILSSADLTVRSKGNINMRTSGNLTVRTSGYAQIVTSGRMLVKSLTKLILKGPRKTIVL